MNKDLLGMRSVALKTYSSLINHCRHTKVVDEEIKKTRKGLINISMDYVQGLATLYTQDDTTFGSVQDTEEKVKFYRSAQQGQILKTLQDFASVAKAGKLNNLFLQSFTQLQSQMQTQSKESLLRNLDVLISLMNNVKLKKDNQKELMQGLKVFLKDPKTKNKAYKLLALIVQKYDLDQGIGELV